MKDGKQMTSEELVQHLHESHGWAEPIPGVPLKNARRLAQEHAIQHRMARQETGESK